MNDNIVTDGPPMTILRMSTGMIPKEYVGKPGIRSLMIKFPDGSIWDVDAEPVAKARAEYYARLDAGRGEGDYRKLFWAEYHYSIRSQDELDDWIKNNMNWEDLTEKKMVKFPDSTAEDYYVNSWGAAEVDGVTMEEAES